MSKPVLILWSILSFIVSGIFVFYGLMILQLEQLPTLSFIAAIIAFSYGLVTIFLLSQAWVKANNKLTRITTYIVVIMFIVQIILNLDVGIISGLEWAGLLIMALMLGINWLSVKYVNEYNN